MYDVWVVGLCEEGAFGRFAKSGYIAVAGGEKNRYLPGKQYRILRILPHHYGLVRPRSPQVVLRGRSF